MRELAVKFMIYNKLRNWIHNFRSRVSHSSLNNCLVLTFSIFYILEISRHFHPPYQIIYNLQLFRFVSNMDYALEILKRICGFLLEIVKSFLVELYRRMNIFPVFYHDYILAGVWEFNVLQLTGFVVKDCDNDI